VVDKHEPAPIDSPDPLQQPPALASWIPHLSSFSHIVLLFPSVTFMALLGQSTGFPDFLGIAVGRCGHAHVWRVGIGLTMRAHGSGEIPTDRLEGAMSRTLRGNVMVPLPLGVDSSMLSMDRQP